MSNFASKSGLRVRHGSKSSTFLQSSVLKSKCTTLIQVSQHVQSRMRRQQKMQEVKQIEDDLMSHLKQLSLAEPMSPMKFHAYQQAFSKAIEGFQHHHKDFLSHIKFAYEKKIDHQQAELDLAKTQIEALQQQLLHERRLNKSLKKQQAVQTLEACNVREELKEKDRLLAECQRNLMKKTSSLSLKASTVAEREDFPARRFKQTKPPKHDSKLPEVNQVSWNLDALALPAQPSRILPSNSRRHSTGRSTLKLELEPVNNSSFTSEIDGFFDSSLGQVVP